MSSSAERMRAMRARRAAAIEAGQDGPALRGADELVSPALEQALAAMDLRPEDAGVVALARAYARVLDTAKDPAWAARWVGPLYQSALESLLGTPMARAKVKDGKPVPHRSDWLDQMRRVRAGQRP